MRGGAKKECTDEDAMFFVQALCMQSEEELTTKFWSGFFLSFVVIINACLYFYTIKYMKDQVSEKYEEWDQATTTTSDFTVVCKVTPEILEEFNRLDKQWLEDIQIEEQKDDDGTYLARYTSYVSKASREGTLSDKALDPNKLKFNNANGSKTWRFKNFFLRSIERILEQRPKVTKHVEQNVKIVDAVFAFKNVPLIKKLMSRGSAIVKGDDELKQKIEKEVDELIEKNQDEFCEPVAAYMTFTNEEGYLRAVNMTKTMEYGITKADYYWLGKPLYFKPAPEPSNICWENQFIYKKEKLIKQLVIVGVLITILAI